MHEGREAKLRISGGEYMDIERAPRPPFFYIVRSSFLVLMWLDRFLKEGL
jgi:hypothetical protein